jgi:FkbM family methyltransferase
LRFKHFISSSKVAKRHASEEDWDRLCLSGEKFALVSGTEKYLVHTNDPIGRELFLHGEYDFRKFELALRLLHRESIQTLVDVGANVGSICIPAVKRGFVEKAIAIEPEPTNFAMLQANLAMNNLIHQIRAFQMALGSEDDQVLLLDLSEDNFGDHRIAPTIGKLRSRQQIQISSSRFDTIVGELNPDTDLIYVDVQGFEKFVIDGAPLATRNKVPMVLEFWPNGLSEHCTMAEFIGCLSDYSTYIDLNSPSPEPTTLKLLSEFWDGLMRGPVDFGDILVY